MVDALNQRYTFAYDTLGRTSETTRAGVSMSYSYDAVGNRTQRTDYNGAVTNYTYDDLNRLTTIAYPDATTATYGYDSLSRLASATNQNGTVTLSYDQMGRVNGTTDVWGQSLTYAYDANGNRTGVSVGGSSVATYQYDAVNRVSNLTDSGGAQVVYGYDITNKIISRLLPNGVNTTYEYDGLSRLTRLQDVKGAAVIGDRQYEYNTANQITQLADAEGPHGYGYDVVDRLTSASNGETFEYYTYDAVGNRTASGLSNYTYAPFNRLGTVGNVGGGEGYSHNANGNRVSQGSTLWSRTFTYDFENRLTQVQVTVPGGPPRQPPVITTVNYKYDALGRRIQRTTSDGANERYVYDGQDVIRDLNANGSVASDYLNGPGIDNKIRQTNAASGTLYYTQDHLGSTRALTDASGNVVEQITYDSFGNGGSALTRYGYTGREHDPVTSLMYYRARFYDPSVGRFISEDPIGLVGGINLFAYVENNPLLSSDPSGLCPQNQPCDVRIPDERARAIVAVALGEGTRFITNGRPTTQFPKARNANEPWLPISEQEYRTEAYYMASVVINRFNAGRYATYADVVNELGGDGRLVFRGAADGWQRLNQLGNNGSEYCERARYIMDALKYIFDQGHGVNNDFLYWRGVEQGNMPGGQRAFRPGDQRAANTDFMHMNPESAAYRRLPFWTVNGWRVPR